jgi:thioredoxin-related protein
MTPSSALTRIARAALLAAFTLALPGCPAKTTAGAGAVPRPVQAKHKTGPVRAKKAPVPVPALDLTNAPLPDTIELLEGWHQLDVPQAARYSKETQKPLFIYFYTKYCGPCKELSKKVFPDPAFQQYIEGLIAVQVDANSDVGEVAAKHFRVHSYPTMIVCEPGGREIERFYGFSSRDKFVGTIGDYLEGKNTAADFRDRSLKDPENLELAFTAGRELAIRKRGEEAIPFLERVWRADTENTTGHVPRAMLLLSKSVYLEQLKARDKALPILEELSDRFPKTYHGTEATYMIARIYWETKEKQKAREVMLERVRIDEKDPIQYFRFANFCIRYGFLLDEAAARIKTGIEKHPRAAYLRKTLAEVHFRNRDYVQAVTVMEEACKMDTANGEVYGRLLETYRKALKRSQEGKQ